MRAFLQQNLNVPNVLSLLRLLLVPVFIALYARGLRTQALIVFVAASLTDLLDGMIARKYNMITDVGKLLDPLADKLMVFSALLMLVLDGTAPLVPLIILAVKELLMIAGGALLLRRGVVVYSSMCGKVAHCAFLLSLVMMFFQSRYPFRIFGMTPDVAVLWISVVLTLIALGFYARSALKLWRGAKPNP